MFRDGQRSSYDDFSDSYFDDLHKGYRANLEVIFAPHLPELMPVDSVETILSVACGEAREAGPLLDIYPQAVYIGIDSGIDDGRGDLRRADRRNRDLVRVTYRQVDGTKSETYKGITPDILVIRNPHFQYADYVTDWEALYRESAAALRNGGILYTGTVGSGGEDMRTALSLIEADPTLQVIRGPMRVRPGMIMESHVLFARKEV